MKKTSVCLLIVFLLCAAVLFAQSGGQEREEAVVVRVTGIVRLVGSGTFPEVVITGENLQWYIAREEMNKLRDLQHRVVTVEAEETVRELTFANGRSAGLRYELRNVTIISMEDYQSP